MDNHTEQGSAQHWWFNDGFYRRARWILVGYTALLGLWMVTGWGGDAVVTAADDIGEVIAAAGAAAACLARSFTRDASRKRFWRLLGLSCLSWMVGQAVATVYETVLHKAIPFPGAPDVFFLLSTPLAIAAVLSIFDGPVGWTSRLRSLVDACIVGSSALFVSWAVLLEGMFHTDGAFLEKTIAIAYPVGDLVAISVVLIAGGRGRIGERIALGWISFGLLSIAVADSGFALLSQSDATTATTLCNLGWVLGFGMIAMAALAPAPEMPRLIGSGERNLVPYIPFLLALVLAGRFALIGEGLQGFLLLDGVVAVGFVCVRQVLTLRENHILAYGLEDKVRARTKELADSEERFRNLISNVSDVIAMVDTEGNGLYLSPSVATVLGFEPEELLGVNLFSLVHPEDISQVAEALEASTGREGPGQIVEVRVRHADGSWRHSETVASKVFSNGVHEGFLLTTRDVTARKILEEQLAHQAFHDPLTGLANRALFCDRLDVSVARVARTGDTVSVVFIDLDEFKVVNDTLGHRHGDAFLREIATRLRTCVRGGDTVARLGGDEFAVLLENANEEVAEAWTRRFQETLGVPVMLDSHEVAASASIGIVTGGGDGRTGADLLSHADVAMYRAKATGRAGYQVFRPEMHEAIVRRVSLQAEMRQAIDEGQFVLHYQPIVDIRSRELTGFEALVRWNHPTRGMVPPLEFISIAEESGLIIPLGRWILEEAVAQLAVWDDLCFDGRPLTVSINVSGRQFASPAFVRSVAETLHRSHAEPERVILELTETMLLDDKDGMVGKLHLLRGLGVRLAIDDFGTGFSSLAYLRNFPVSSLKIDKSFVDDMLSGRRGAELARAVVEIGRVLELSTVAEGIETEDQATALEAIGCRFGQGYLYSKPLPAAAVEELLLRPTLALTS